jgi:hypothetical protein
MTQPRPRKHKDAKALALDYAPAALAELARLAASADSESARVAAIRELLDRGFGKARQAVELDGELRARLVIENVVVEAGKSGKSGGQDPS